MYRPVDVIEVILWGSRVGAVALDPHTNYYAFEYDPAWVKKSIELSPFFLGINQPPRRGNNSRVFVDLPDLTFKRLPAMLADSLPDKFGNALIDAALANEGIPKEQVTPLDRLAYMSNRAMGALEFRPPRGTHREHSTAIQLSLLVEGARNVLEGKFDGHKETEAAIKSIIQVGISAGGARAKAVVAWNPQNHEIRSGHAKLEDGFEHWLLKLDGVGTDLVLGAGYHYGRIEYAYYLMALEAGITMMPSRLLEENGRAHFMTKRYDRQGAEKFHTQSLCALKHLDFNLIAVNSYAQYFEAIEGLGLDVNAKQEGFRRMVFNVITANCDDHTKNFSFLMPPTGQWRMTPAYDITHAHNPGNQWLKQHLMSVNGKFFGIERADFMAIADRFQVPDANAIINEILDSLAHWPEFADLAGIPAEEKARIANDFQPVNRRATRPKF